MPCTKAHETQQNKGITDSPRGTICTIGQRSASARMGPTAAGKEVHVLRERSGLAGFCSRGFREPRSGGGSVRTMRVIGGTARGRQLRAPRSSAVRPTTDRVREAMFDVLTHLGAVAGATVLDGFAGSGALGIEALSRGARAVTFVEADRKAAATLEDNLRATGFAGLPGVRVVRSDLLSYLGATREFDLALLDPPYAFDGWPQLLGRLRCGIAVLESDRALQLPPHLELHRSYRYGTTLVTVARAVTAASPDDGGPAPSVPGQGSERSSGAAGKEGA